MVDGFTDVIDFLKDLPNKIFQGIKAIFVPDTEEMKQEFANLMNQIAPMSIGSDNMFFEADEKAPIDVTIDYDFGLFKLDDLTIVDYSPLKKGVEFFRPIINSFLVFLLGWFSINQYLSFIGQVGNIASTVHTQEREKMFDELREKKGKN